jgi:ABC-2 type transport system ATP-binding protein
VRFRLPDAIRKPPLDAMLAGDGTWSFTSDDPTGDLHQLTGWAIEHDVRLESLSVSPPTLEDVYLELTQDGAAESDA